MLAETITLAPKQGYEDKITGFKFRNNKPYPVTYVFKGSEIISQTRAVDPEVPASDAPSFLNDFERELKALMDEYRVTRVITSKGGTLKKLTFADADGDKVSIKL